MNSMALLVLREDIGILVLNHTFQVISSNERKRKGSRKLIGFKEFLLKKESTPLLMARCSCVSGGVQIKQGVKLLAVVHGNRPAPVKEKQVR